jgi:hypothetical protein
MGVKLVSSGGGSVEINPPATASNFVATMPAATGNVVVDSATQTLTNKAWSSPAGSTITSATAVTASGTAVDFTGIPSWVRRITVMFSGLSTSGLSLVQVQLGDGGGVETSSYAGVTQVGASPTAHSTGFLVDAGGPNAAVIRQGSVTLTNVSTNTWVAAISTCWSSNTIVVTGSGSKTLSDTLDRVRITTVNGTDTFDAGSINILYE